MRIDYMQLDFIDKNLRDMMDFLEDETGLEFTITSLYRIGDSGVHGQLPLRGCDLRMRHKMIGIECEALINRTWKYDHMRPTKNCAVLHGSGYNLHLHLQTHPNTRRV